MKKEKAELIKQIAKVVGCSAFFLAAAYLGYKSLSARKKMDKPNDSDFTEDQKASEQQGEQSNGQGRKEELNLKQSMIEPEVPPTTTPFTLGGETETERRSMRRMHDIGSSYATDVDTSRRRLSSYSKHRADSDELTIALYKNWSAAQK
eukprot:TRINITY_DN5310_c0_g1_i2.p1 TRINITY_DN5310_c0_g1~~TRINITY_DN5310_c0_g1_i2.p1  ORF type:complete len:149 (+),score=32.94 TRINITY_DN5310_c0_g1_i2:35-481(+)